MRALLIVALGGCHELLDLEDIGTSEHCFGRNGQDGAGLAEICVTGEPAPWSRPTAINTGRRATATDPSDDGDCRQVLQVDENEACVMIADSIAITEPVQFTGRRPLVLVSAT